MLTFKFHSIQFILINFVPLEDFPLLNFSQTKVPFLQENGIYKIPWISTFFCCFWQTMAIVRYQVHVHWVPEMGSMDVTASEQPYYWYFDPQEPAFKKMYGILWSSLCEHVSEEAIITDVKINGFNTIETHPAAFLQQGDVVHVYFIPFSRGLPPNWHG